MICNIALWILFLLLESYYHCKNDGIISASVILVIIEGLKSGERGIFFYLIWILKKKIIDTVLIFNELCQSVKLPPDDEKGITRKAWLLCG